MNTRIRIFLTVVLSSAALVAMAVLMFGGLGRFMGVRDPETGSNVLPEKVTFLRLTPSASNIGYWDNGYQQAATFTVSEETFLSIFAGHKFSPITGQTSYHIWQFGAVTMPPHKTYQTQATTSGLFHDEIWKNGGSRRIVFDRHRQLCSYHLVRW